MNDETFDTSDPEAQHFVVQEPERPPGVQEGETLTDIEVTCTCCQGKAKLVRCHHDPTDDIGLCPTCGRVLRPRYLGHA